MYAMMLVFAITGTVMAVAGAVPAVMSLAEALGNPLWPTIPVAAMIVGGGLVGSAITMLAVGVS